MAEFNDFMKSENRSHFTTSNDSLICKDCANRYNDADPLKNGTKDDDGRLYGPTTVCSKYKEQKPNRVLLGGKCDEYKHE